MMFSLSFATMYLVHGIGNVHTDRRQYTHATVVSILANSWVDSDDHD